MFSGNEAGHGFRLYVESPEESKPRPISPEGVNPPVVISPKGDFVAGVGPDHKVRLDPIASGEPVPVSGILHMSADRLVRRWPIPLRFPLWRDPSQSD